MEAALVNLYDGEVIQGIILLIVVILLEIPTVYFIDRYYFLWGKDARENSIKTDSINFCLLDSRKLGKINE